MRPTSDSDEALCHRIKNGDEYAFKVLFDRYYEPLYRFFCHRGMEFALAEDMAQDIFVRVWQKRNSLDPSKAIKAYLYQAAANEIGMFLRKKSVRDAHATDVLHQNSTGSYTSAEFDQKEFIAKTVQSLPETLRNVFILHRYDGLSYKEIAQLQAVSIKTIESRMSKALKYLRKELLPLVQAIILLLLCNG